MVSPKLPTVVAAAVCAIVFIYPTAALFAGTPAPDDTGRRTDLRLAAYEHLLHNGPEGAVHVDPSSATNRDSWDVLSYKLRLVPDFAVESLWGAVTMTLAALEPSVETIELDLYDHFQITSVNNGATNLTFTHVNDLVRIDLDRSLGVGDQASFTIIYEGAPEPVGPLGFDFDMTSAGRPTLTTVSEPFYARSWWPCKDTPLDKAQVELVVVVPPGMQAAAPGKLVNTTHTSNTSIYHWATEYPITTYGVSIAVSEYVSWTEDYTAPDGTVFPLEYHVFPEDEQIARYEFERVGEMIDMFTELYGPYAFPAEKYGMAEVVLQGAMEHQTLTSYGDFFLTGDRYYEGIVAHELSHHWWGNLITLTDWNDTWLHEAMATFSDGLWREHIDGREAYLTFLRQRSHSCCGFTGPISPPTRLFNQVVYYKGAWMLHMLRELVGNDDFFAALRLLTADPELRYKNFSKSTFVDAFETQTGEQLDWFFDQWLHREGRPELSVQWSPVAGSSAAPVVRIEVEQVQPEDEWLFPLRLRLHLPSGPVDVDTFISDRTTSIDVAVAEWPNSVEIDPDTQLLHFDMGSVRVTDTPQHVHRSTQLLPNTPNPFNPRTSLRFNLAEPGAVQLRIFDLRGRLVRTLDCGSLGAGEHSRIWDGSDDRGRSVASGTYLVQLDAAGIAPPARTITLVR